MRCGAEPGDGSWRRSWVQFVPKHDAGARADPSRPFPGPVRPATADDLRAGAARLPAGGGPGRGGGPRREGHLPAGARALRQGGVHPLPARSLLVRLLAGGGPSPVSLHRQAPPGRGGDRPRRLTAGAPRVRSSRFPPTIRPVRRDLSSIFKAYDIRGVVPDDLDDDAARRIGAAFARFTGADRVVVGRDCRVSSPPLAAAFIEGLTGQGTDVIDVGLASTDMVYFATGDLRVPGAMFTASHNPPQWNGIKLCREAAAPIGETSGLAEIRALAEAGPSPGATRGTVQRGDILDRYVGKVLSFI